MPMEVSRQKVLDIADDNPNLQEPFIHLFVQSGIGVVPMSSAQKQQSKERDRANFRICSEFTR